MKTNIIGYFEYITSAGDTFDSLAFINYLDEKMSSHIIKANISQADTIIFEQGVLLLIPILDKIESPQTLPPWRRS